MDPFWIAVVSASSAVVGAFVGALPNLLQSRALRRESEKERVRAVEAERYDRAVKFTDAIAGFAIAQVTSDSINLHRFASQFIATLRAGEGAVADYVRLAVVRVHDVRTPSLRLEAATDVADNLFKYLRGDATAIAILQSVNAHAEASASS